MIARMGAALLLWRRWRIERAASVVSNEKPDVRNVVVSGKSALGEDYRLTDLRFTYRTNGRKWRTKLVVRIAGMLWLAAVAV